MGGGAKYPYGYLDFKDTYGQNFNGHTHVFEVHLFNGAVDDITGSRVIPEIDMAATRTGLSNLNVHDSYKQISNSIGILFLAVLCAEIVLLPVWAAVISISGIMRLPVVLATRR